MARPLTKTESEGSLYRRPAEVEAQIDEVAQLSFRDLRSRLTITNRGGGVGYLRSECLVHLIREGRRCDNQSLMSAVLPVLLGRCEANLLGKISDNAIPDAESLRQEVLDALSELFVVDGFSDCPNELDFYECRFNKAFNTLRIDAVRRHMRRVRLRVDMPPSELASESATEDEALKMVSEAFRVLPTHEWDTFGEPFLTAIEALPPDEREAVVLVHVLGYKEESEDSAEDTAATRCKCTGRTIRNRLTRAAARLSRFKEYL